MEIIYVYTRFRGVHRDVAVQAEDRGDREWSRALKQAPTLAAKEFGARPEQIEALGAY